MLELGAVIRTARGSMTGAKLEELSGVPSWKISRIETGSYKDVPDPDALGGLSRALGIPQSTMLEALGYDVSGSLVRSVDPNDVRQKIRDLIERVPDRDRLEGVADMLSRWVYGESASSLASSDTK